ncbi:MAG: Xaa-Pro peptidase family protein [Lentisphaeria bacterium]|nr:Xaa-Pro peptidase family protein [Lentisphaeria bacterium]
MGFMPTEVSRTHIDRVREIMERKNYDAVLVYYDEFNIGNGWYLTGWCPQFESGAVLVPRHGESMLLGGPESEPFAKQDSAVKKTRNFKPFMVPDEEYPASTVIGFPELFAELRRNIGALKKIGVVGADRMPTGCYNAIAAGFSGVELADATDDYLRLRYIKDDWERGCIRKAFALADVSYDAMKAAIRPGAQEIQVAAAGEYAARSRGASGFGFTAIVGSGTRANAVVPTASSKILTAGETVMIGLAPKVNGYAGVMGDYLPVSGEYTSDQKECLKVLREAFRLTRAMLKPGAVGRDIDAPARRFCEKHGLDGYLICPFAHTIGIHEAESPFFGPNSGDVLQPGMTVCVDVSFFGHPKWHGSRIETGFEITETGAKPLSAKMDALHTSEVE